VNAKELKDLESFVKSEMMDKKVAAALDLQLEAGQLEKFVMSHPQGISVMLGALARTPDYLIANELTTLEDYVQHLHEKGNLEESKIFVTRLRAMLNMMLSWHLTPEAKILNDMYLRDVQKEAENFTKQ